MVAVSGLIGFFNQCPSLLNGADHPFGFAKSSIETGSVVTSNLETSKIKS